MSDSSSIRAVEFTAEISKVSTMVDSTFNLVLNLPESCALQAAQLLHWHGVEVRVVLEISANESDI